MGLNGSVGVQSAVLVIASRQIPLWVQTSAGPSMRTTGYRETHGLTCGNC